MSSTNLPLLALETGIADVRRIETAPATGAPPPRDGLQQTPTMTLLRDDPLADPTTLLARVYAYVAYRVGDGPDAEDIVAATFERAVRYRHTYRRRRGTPMAWLVSIAKNTIADTLAVRRDNPSATLDEHVDDARVHNDLEVEVVTRVSLNQAVAALSERDRELIALRYGADLTARAIGSLLDIQTNAVEVALHRALERLRRGLAAETTLEHGEADIS